MRVINDREYESEACRFSQSIGGSPRYSVNFSRVMADRSTSVSSVVWSVESGRATITSEALASNVASAILSSPNTDKSLIKIIATQADGGTRVRYIELHTTEPNRSSSDYC